MMRSRSLRVLAALLATVLLLGACSDDGGSDDETATTAEPTTTEGDDEATTTTEADDEATTTTEADETSDEGAGDEASGGGSIDIGALAEIDDICVLYEGSEEFDAADAILAGQTAEMPSAAEMEEAFLFMQAFFARLVEVAPDEIRDDVVTVAGGVDDLMGILADYEFDFMAMGAAAASDPEVAARMEALGSDEFVTASENIERWVADNCG